MSQPLATTRAERADGRVTLSIDGEIDLSNAETLLHEIEVVADGSVTSLVIDLTHVGFMDSQGVRLLHRISQRAELAGCRLTVIAPDGGSPAATLRITGMDRILAVQDHA